MASYIDQYYDDLMSRMYYPKRTIASEPIEEKKPQTEATTYVIDTQDRKPIEPTFRDPEKQKPEYVQNYIDNINPALKDQYNLYGDLENRRQKRESDYYSSRENLLKAAEAGAVNPEPFKSSYDYDAKIKELSDAKDMQQAPDKYPEPSMAAEIIKMVGAPLLGSMLGESGQIAQLKAQKDIDEKDKEIRKEAILRQRYGQVKKANLEDEISKRMIALGQLKKGEYDVYEKDRKFKQEQLKGLTDILKTINPADAQRLKEVEADMQQLGINVTKNTMEGSEKYAKLQADEARAAEAMERARLDAQAKQKVAKTKPAELPLEIKEQVKKLANEKARMFGINSQVEQLKSQIGDKSIPEQERLSSAQEQLKLLNSTLGSDAVGAEEGRRLSAYLEITPNFVKRSFGPDLDGFYNQLDRINKRIVGSSNTIQNQIDKLYGRKPSAPISVIKKNEPIKEPIKKEIKTINGVDYEKTKGGWKRVTRG